MQRHYTIEELERLVGRGSSYVSSHDRNDHVTTHQPPLVRRDVRRDIYDFVLQSGRAVTRGEIAKALKLKKTGWLHNHIEQLVTDGYLIRFNGHWHNGMIMFWYEVAR